MASPRFLVSWAVVRVATSAAILAAIVGQLIRTVGLAIEETTAVAVVVANFFSFFTILSNLLAMIVLTVAAVWLLRHRDGDARHPLPLAAALAAVSTYMIITGIVYNALLRNIPLPQGSTVPWSNEILHVYAPILLLLDVLLAPRVRALKWRAIAFVAGFPVVWVIYTLIRGPLVTNPFTGAPVWYPYPFLNPGGFANGYGTVVLYILGIAAAIIAIAAVVVAIGRRRARGAWAQTRGSVDSSAIAEASRSVAAPPG